MLLELVAMVRVPKPKEIVLPVTLSPHELKGFEADPAWRDFIPQMKALAADGLTTTDVELYTYALYYEWDEDPLGMRSHADFRRILPRRWQTFEDFLSVEKDHSLRWKRSTNRHMTELLGIGGSLALSSAILGVTEADYEPIPEAGRPTLDYTRRIRGSRRNVLFEVEAKGTTDGASTSDQRSSIRSKKAEPPTDRHKRLRIGVIVDVANEKARQSHLEIVDPPSDAGSSDPSLMQLWYRMNFYLRELRAIAQRIPLTTALANRVRVLDRLAPSTWSALNSIPLSDERLEPLGVPPRVGFTLDLGTIFEEDVIHGRLYPFEDEDGEATATKEDAAAAERTFLFRGLERKVLEALQEQSYSGILDLASDRKLMPLPTNIGIAGTLVRFASGLVSGLVTGPADLVKTSRTREGEPRLEGRRRRRRRWRRRAWT